MELEQTNKKRLLHRALRESIQERKYSIPKVLTLFPPIKLLPNLHKHPSQPINARIRNQISHVKLLKQLKMHSHSVCNNSHNTLIKVPLPIFIRKRKGFELQSSRPYIDNSISVSHDGIHLDEAIDGHEIKPVYKRSQLKQNLRSKNEYDKLHLSLSNN